MLTSDSVKSILSAFVGFHHKTRKTVIKTESTKELILTAALIGIS